MFTILTQDIAYNSIEQKKDKQNLLANEVNEFIQKHSSATVKWLQSESNIHDGLHVTLTAIIKYDE